MESVETPYNAFFFTIEGIKPAKPGEKKRRRKLFSCTVLHESGTDGQGKTSKIRERGETP